VLLEPPEIRVSTPDLQRWSEEFRSQLTQLMSAERLTESGLGRAEVRIELQHNGMGGITVDVFVQGRKLTERHLILTTKDHSPAYPARATVAVLRKEFNRLRERAR